MTIDAESIPGYVRRHPPRFLHGFGGWRGPLSARHTAGSALLRHGRALDGEAAVEEIGRADNDVPPAPPLVFIRP